MNAFDPNRSFTRDQRRSEILRLFQVPDYPNVFVLGCYARHVTFYSQQVRALNLIDALCKLGIVTAKGEIAVVGAGLAGLTAAVGAAVRGATVRVFERLEEGHNRAAKLPLQRTSRQRAIHPRIYDWPEAGAVEDAAGLPVLDWQAGMAHEVIEQILDAYRDLHDSIKNRIYFDQTPVQDVRIVRTSDRSVRLEWREKGVTNEEEFRLAILAVGFGLEGESGHASYWTDDDLDSLIQTRRKWLVSGYGDGALTDLMRLCIPAFGHGEVVKEFAEAVPDADALRLLESERRRGEDEDLSTTYRELARKIAVRPSLRGLDVSLNCSEEQLFSAQSSILNRVIAAWLLENKGFTLLERPGLIRSAQRLDGRPTGKLWEVRFESGQELQFDGVVLRHGTSPAMAEFPAIDQACQALKKQWETASHWVDWTRKPLWESGDFGEAEDIPVSELDVDFGEEVGCIVVTDGETQGSASLLSLVRSALGWVSGDGFSDKYERKLSGDPVELNLNHVLKCRVATGPRVSRFERLVRALCIAEIAVCDITRTSPAMMLLLGIRSAARRGVTITVRREEEGIESGDDNLPDLPFNVQEVSPVTWEKGGDRQFRQAIRYRIAEGFAKLKALPLNYLDLPAYDALRALGSESREHYDIVQPEDLMLIMSWFDPDYLKTDGDFVRRVVEDTFKEAANPEYIPQTKSPQLASQKIYDAIRRTSHCVVDWTGWRPNVFFEYGVRLAVNRDEAFPILREQDADEIQNDAQKSALKALFDPFVFSTETAEREVDFSKALKAHYEGGSSSSRCPALSTGRVFELVYNAIDVASEPPSKSVPDILRHLAHQLVGAKPRETGGVLPVLFAENPRLERLAWEQAVHRMIAAWDYLAKRRGILALAESGSNELKTEEVQLLRDIGQELNDWIEFRGLRDREYVEIRNEVEQGLEILYQWLDTRETEGEEDAVESD